MKIAMVAALAVLVVACGGSGGGSGDDDSEPPPTSAEARNEVTALTITVGQFTFDALGAGDPAGAADGKLVLLLHGFPETAESYRDFLVPLADAGYYAVAVSQRGYSPGARPPAVEDYNLLALVEDVSGIAAELGAERYHLVGHDWGGAVVWLAAALDPDAVLSLTALATPHPDAINEAAADPNSPQATAFGYMQTFRAEGSEQQFLTDGAATFEAIFGTGGGIPEDKVELYAEVLATPEALRAALNWYRANPLPVEARVGAIKVPTLYVYGVDDIAFLPPTARATEALVDAPYTYLELEGYGHWLPETASAEIIPALIEHLDGV